MYFAVFLCIKCVHARVQPAKVTPDFDNLVDSSDSEVEEGDNLTLLARSKFVHASLLANKKLVRSRFLHSGCVCVHLPY